MSTNPELPVETRRTPLPYWTLLFSTLGLLIPIALFVVLYFQTYPASPGDPMAEKLREQRANEQEQLTTYGWIEKPAAGKPGVVRIPAERAKELMLKEAAEGKP